MQRLRGTGWLPRRVALLGSLEPLPAGEVGQGVRGGHGQREQRRLAAERRATALGREAPDMRLASRGCSSQPCPM